MKTALPSDAEIAREALDVLMQHMPASKVARLLSALQVGKGDYIGIREKLFAGESVDDIFKKAAALKQSSHS